jgi:hypothetical protein
MNCTRAKSEIALWAGGDLDDRQIAQLERHVAVCPDCREYRQRMSGSLQVLHNPGVSESSGLHDSVWPGVESRLSVQSQIEARRAERLNRWLPAAAIAAACLAVIAFTSEPAPQPRTLQGQLLPPDLQSWDMGFPYGTVPRVDGPADLDGGQGFRKFDSNRSHPLPLWPNDRRMSYDWVNPDKSMLNLARDNAPE